MKKRSLRLMSILLSLSMVMGSFSLPAYATQIGAYEVQDEIVADILENDSAAVSTDETVANETVADESVKDEIVIDETVEDNPADDFVVNEDVADEIEESDDESAITEETDSEIDGTVVEAGKEETDKEETGESEVVEASEGAESAIITASEPVTLRISGIEHVKIDGLDSNNEIKVELTGNGVEFPMIIEEGYALFEGKTNALNENNSYISVNYHPDQKKCSIDTHEARTPEANVINVELVVLPVTNITIEFKEDIDFSHYSIGYCYEGENWSYSGEKQLESNVFELLVPIGIDTYITSFDGWWLDDKQQDDSDYLDDYVFNYKDSNGEAGEYVELKMHKVKERLVPCINVPDDKGIALLATKVSEENRYYYISSNTITNAVIWCDGKDNLTLLDTKIRKGEAFTFGVLCNPGYDVLGVEYTVNGEKYLVDKETITEAHGAKIIPIPKIKTTGDLNINIMIGAKSHLVSSKGDHYYIKSLKREWNTDLEDVISEKEAYRFFVKGDERYVIEKVLYSTSGKQTELKSNGGNANDGFSYVIPAGVKDDVLIAVVTKPVSIDFNKVKVAMYFGDLSKPGTVVAFNKAAAESANGIVPAKIEVKDASGKVVNSSIYSVKYENNKEAGTAYIEVTPKPEFSACFGSKKVSYTIGGVSLSDTKKIKVEVTSPVNWDNKIASNNVPNVVVTDISDPKNNFPLGIDSDFEAAFTVPTTPGTYSITVIGLGGYYGSRTVKYNVVKPSFANATEDGANGSIKIETIAAQDYTAKAIKPVPVITYNGIELVEGVDYTIKGYGNNINAYELSEGDEGFIAKKAPSITIAGKGNYQGTKKVYFKISKVSLDDSAVKIAVPSYKYTGKEIKAKPVITMVDETGKVVKTFKENTDYTLEYFENVEASSEALVKIVSTASGNLDRDTVESFTIANNNIADKVISIAMAAKKGDAPNTAYAADYTGNAIEPYVCVVKKISDTQYDNLEKEKDYKIVYENNVNAGKAKVTIIGCGKYYGKVTKTFTINKRTVHAEDASAMNIYLDGKNISVLPHYKYTGNAIKPAVKVVDPNFNDYELKEGVDYTVSFANNTNVSLSTKSPTVTIKFKGNYAGVKAEKTNTISGYFAIDSWDLSKAIINVKDADKIVYTGKALKPAVEVINPDGNVVNPKVLKYAYKNNVNAKLVINADKPTEDSPVVMISPANKYITAPEVATNTYQVIKGFTINKANLAEVIKKIKIPDQVFKGEAVNPKITVKFAGKILKENEDYSLIYDCNNRRGLGRIKVTTVAESANFKVESAYGVSSIYLEYVIK